MPKFSGSKAAKSNTVKAPAKTLTKQGDPDTTTFEGGAGWTKDDKTALFSLAVTNMVSENTYYEEGGKRDKRFVDLIHKVAKDDPDWIARFIPYLRDTMNMRSASVVMAVETVRALLGTKHGINLRNVVDSAVVRADEPAEILAYYTQEYGRNFPMPVKRGVADAARRVYSERSALKYDGLSREFRMGDVIELVHPEPEGDRQSAVFKYLLDRRHNAEWPEGGYPALSVIQKTHEIDSIPVEKRREALINGEIDFSGSGFTWERVSGWINGPMDAKVWEAIIPQMGYMALLRNLRNFEQAGISKDAVKYVQTKLSDPAEVEKSRQFPYRFLSAYLATNSVLWDSSLEEALDLSTQNVPEFPGKTLVLVDVSGSMQSPISEKSKVQRYQIAAVLGATIAAKGGDVDLVPYATRWTEIDVPKGSSILKVSRKLDDVCRTGRLDHGTETWAAMKATYNGHNRIINISDMQAFGGYGPKPDSFVKSNIYNFDVGGYGKTNMAIGEKGRFEFAGFNDAAFKAIKIIEDKTSAGWPF